MAKKTPTLFVLSLGKYFKRMQLETTTILDFAK
jgi:hypothetical protein